MEEIKRKGLFKIGDDVFEYRKIRFRFLPKNAIDPEVKFETQYLNTNLFCRFIHPLEQIADLTDAHYDISYFRKENALVIRQQEFKNKSESSNVMHLAMNIIDWFYEIEPKIDELLNDKILEMKETINEYKKALKLLKEN